MIESLAFTERKLCRSGTNFSSTLSILAKNRLWHGHASHRYLRASFQPPLITYYIDKVEHVEQVEYLLYLC